MEDIKHVKKEKDEHILELTHYQKSDHGLRKKFFELNSPPLV